MERSPIHIRIALSFDGGGGEVWKGTLEGRGGGGGL
jgi:hypothetical protein